MMKKLNTWHEVYRHIGELLNEFYLTYQSKTPQELYKKLSKSPIGSNNKQLFGFDAVDIVKGLDPVQIYATFNYSKITADKRLTNIRLLIESLGSTIEIGSNIDFAGIPGPIITRIIQFRDNETQNSLWAEFHKIFNHGIAGINQKTFDSITKWKGLDIPSYTMFLFWLDSKEFLPLDQNTVAFLKSYNFISARPKSYNEYKTCIQRIKTSGYKSNETGDVIRFIVKDAYNFSNKTYKGDIISGSTASVISEDSLQPGSINKIQKEAIQKQKELFKNFEIIAIRPKVKERRENDIDRQRHLKNLIEGQLYQFYETYTFSQDDDKTIKYDKSKGVNIFNVNDLNVSICAIVGKNGSGKSTLVELLYLIVNKIAFTKKIKSTEKIISEEIFADLFFKSDKLYKISVGEKLEVYEYKFEEDANIYTQLTEDSQGEENFKKFDVENFCYSLVINYSLYGLNSEIIGNWINPLFHKNDSYQVPIVLNPKRDDGIINVNIEDSLAKSRLLSNLFEPNLIDFEKNIVPELVPGSIPQKIVLELDNEKFRRKRGKYVEIYGKKVSKRDINKLVREYNLTILDSIEFINEAKEYIYLKTVSIAYNYPRFKDYKDLPKWIDDKEKVKEYISQLKQETSHITFKLRQAINYLQYGIYNTVNENFILELASEIQKIQISNSSDEELRTIDLVPPPFLMTNVVFDHGGNFNALSSGEKQQVYSINTIVYHLYNIKSVMVYKDIYKYNCVNIIFDEVELYFHPDMQRTYISNLLRRIGTLRLNDENGINNINIMFVTHSPFILSDIPKSNVLMLEVDEKGRSIPANPVENTFAANIHELLANNFFLSSSIGEFANEKINEILDFYNKVRNARPKDIATLRGEYNNRGEYFNSIVQNIGEEFVRGLIKNNIEFIEETLIEQQKSVMAHE